MDPRTRVFSGPGLVVVSCAVAFSLVLRACCHQGHSGEAPPCSATDSPLQINAAFVPGTITVDGQTNDWDSVEGTEAVIQQALGQNSGQPQLYPQGDGALTVKAAHDGKNVYFLLKLPGPYLYNAENQHLSVSASLMFGIGDDATLYNMGGCPQQPDHCSPVSCRNHEVDLVQFEVKEAIPGRQYGRNLLDLLEGTGSDRIGNLSDGYGFNPHCKYNDHVLNDTGLTSRGSAENDWAGVWSHTAVDTSFGLVKEDSPFGTIGDPGSFIFELSRPLRSADTLQQDVQFTIGSRHRMGVAIWYPVDGQPWQDHQHYILSCDWAQLFLAPAPVPMYGWSSTSGTSSISTTAATALSAMAMVLSLAAVFVSIVVGWWVRANSRHFDTVVSL